MKNAVSTYDYNPQTFKALNRKKIIDLPSGGVHFTRSLLIQDNQLYISIGSSCNVCNESDWRRAKILVSNLDDSNLHVFASGLRNSVFVATHPTTHQIWATDMGRDFLGDNLPPDEVNIISDSKHYGWPYCYGKNVPDKTFAKTADCAQSTPSHLDIPAHSAPLGLALLTPNQLLVAYHGSWNRTTPTGYKIVLHDLLTSTTTDILSWETTRTIRPVDILVASPSTFYFSDDKSGTVYKVTLTQKGGDTK